MCIRQAVCGMQAYLKSVIFLAVLIILLQAFHMIILMRMQEAVPSTHITTHRILKEDVLSKSMKDALRDVTLASIMDTSGTYMIIPNIVKPVAEIAMTNYSVSLCTQTTANHLHYLTDLTEAWSGPMSVTVFTHGLDTIHAVYTLIMLHHCSHSIFNHVRFHLAYPISHPPLRLKSASKKKLNCDDFLSSKYYVLGKNYENDLPYPHNMLRNVAIMFSKSAYIFVIDIDFIPSANLYNQFKHFIQRHYVSFELSKQSGDYKPTAFVVPSFESNLTSPAPLNKDELIREWKNGSVRPFYYDMCWKCQKVTDYEQWRSLPSVGFIETGFYVDWKDPWEPFFIARRSELPLYDGRFKQYGFNRISQVCEMHVSGFKFAVLNNGFIVHRGFKAAETFHDRKKEENDKNRELFRTFKRELKDRYPNSKLEC